MTPYEMAKVQEAIRRAYPGGESSSYSTLPSVDGFRIIEYGPPVRIVGHIRCDFHEADLMTKAPFWLQEAIAEIQYLDEVIADQIQESAMYQQGYTDGLASVPVTVQGWPTPMYAIPEPPRPFNAPVLSRPAQMMARIIELRAVLEEVYRTVDKAAFERRFTLGVSREVLSMIANSLEKQ